MRTYKLEFGWEIDFPEEWVHEIGEKGVDVFYPPNDSTTVYASVFTAYRQGDKESAPAEILEDFFVKSINAHSAEEIPLAVDGLGCRAFFAVDSKGIYRVSAGVFTIGNLLTLNVYSASEDTVYNIAEDIFTRVRFTEG